MYDKYFTLCNFKNVFYFVDQICYRKSDNPNWKNTERGWVKTSFSFLFFFKINKLVNLDAANRS